jgi:hypothetical protein
VGQRHEPRAIRVDSTNGRADTRDGKLGEPHPSKSTPGALTPGVRPWPVTAAAVWNEPPA